MTREESQARTQEGYDVLGLSLVTIGDRASQENHRLFQAWAYTRYLYLHGLSVETAEALAELTLAILHRASRLRCHSRMILSFGGQPVRLAVVEMPADVALFVEWLRSDKCHVRVVLAIAFTLVHAIVVPEPGGPSKVAPTGAGAHRRTLEDCAEPWYRMSTGPEGPPLHSRAGRTAPALVRILRAER